MPNTLHNSLTAGELHYSKILISATAPTAIPTYQGQSYFNTAFDIFYIAVGTSSADDWQPVITGASVNSEGGTTYTVTSLDNGKIIDMTSSAARTVTLPASPVNGFQVGVFDGSGNAFTNTLTIDASGGNQFWDGETVYKIVSNYAGITLTYDDATSKWITTGEAIGGTLNIDSILDTTSIVNDIDHTKQLQFALAGATTSTKTTFHVSQTVNRDLTFPDVTDTFTVNAAPQTLSNKSFDTTPVVIKSAQALRFNNSGNTFYSSFIAGNNSANISYTLPIVTPTANQSLTSDGSSVLSWSGLSTGSEQSVAKATNINALASSTSCVLLTGTTVCNLNGITAGFTGQKITIVNVGTVGNVTVVNSSGSASATNRIAIPNSLNLTIPYYYSLEFIYTSQLVWEPVSQIYAANIIGKLPNISADVIPLGFIGEEITDYQNGISITNTGYTDTASITLTQGIWDIYLSTTVEVNTTGSSNIEILGGISPTPGVTFPSPMAAQNFDQFSILVTTNTLTNIIGKISIIKYRYIASATTQAYFAKAIAGQVGGSFTNATASSFLQAIRVG